MIVDIFCVDPKLNQILKIISILLTFRFFELKLLFPFTLAKTIKKNNYAILFNDFKFI